MHVHSLSLGWSEPELALQLVLITLGMNEGTAAGVSGGDYFVLSIFMSLFFSLHPLINC